MIAYVEGILSEKTPTYAIIDCNGIGYLIYISLNTFTRLPDQGKCRLLTHQIIKEDAHQLFGFIDQEERNLFRLLITVQGVGANTARMILSSLSVKEVILAIAQNQVAVLQGVKGIGGKTAQKIILELKDKLVKEESGAEIYSGINNTLSREALSALLMLGFTRVQSEKAVHSAIRAVGSEAPLEEIIKAALKIL